MYHKNPDNQMDFPDFDLPFNGKLNPKNRWVILAKLTPWDAIEVHYQGELADTGMGAPARNSRMAFGALIIKEKMGLTDIETVEQITENPYLQYFVGLHQYTDEPPFDSSMMVHFRKRFKTSGLNDINEAIVKTAKEATKSDDNEENDDPSDDAPTEDQKKQSREEDNNGKLIIDATCTPADITYPTDMKLLNHTRETLERVIDRLHKPLKGELKKPRTYRKNARKDFIAYIRKKKPKSIMTHQAIGAQLNYIRRDLGHIDTLLEQGAKLTILNDYDYKCLLVSHTIYEQQLEMYVNEVRRVDDRIVNMMQPHVRPIIRGKVGKNVEFGAKISVSSVEGYVHLDRLSWDAFNESGDLEMQVEAYKKRHGCYPESVHADQIYKTRANRSYCKEKGIRLSGPPLGRPRKETEKNKEDIAAIKQQIYDDEIVRIEIEGKFGNCKRKGTLARIMAKLVDTSEAVIGIGLIMLNLDKALREVVCWLCFWLSNLQIKAYGVVRMTSETSKSSKGVPIFILRPLEKLAA